ncbi:GNAT family N-acetyltransferase [Leptolyngbya sp. PCC 6406]|uniref:GNAT family N-acetyltransferase n=1 Tax=Leptolyngbya sp. PCC 6406 TaxID=1173264 RepID=UPI0002AC85C2|nr:GNAT family N-acetyltransferase [Leptolyngbya sp. PCC 6406]
MMTCQIREIQAADNGAIAAIIRQVLTEFGANCGGFAWSDPELEDLARAYAKPGYAYFVAIAGDQVVGGAGIAPFPCEYPDLCELQKMYLLPEWRGQGLGRALMDQVVAIARDYGYHGCYLETFRTMTGAMAFYERSGFRPQAQPLGNSGHHACDRFYLRWFDNGLKGNNLTA